MLEENIKKVLEEIADGNNLGEKITLVGASKTMSVETINKAVALGVKVVAENKVQEFREKTDFIVGAEQQFIGHLQTNKVKYLVGRVSLIQSVDSVHLAEAINNQALKKQVVQDILVEINVGGELSKSGFSFENAKDGIREIKESFPCVRILGLMAMLPHTDDNELLINLCEKMRSLYDELNAQGYNFKYLSMGMSADYELAIKHG
ncbi:MAG: YggS family pyridoxal phosphate-dependent enzyme, partial [Clostridia bacterium]|nr:YggS family pyridoxal phosphate-dependent enzyme [Clostridia bacterium]